MSPSPATQRVLQFWQTVWNPPYDLDYIDTAVTDDFIITNAGKDIVSKAAFKTWVAGFQKQVNELHLGAEATFANVEDSLVVSRWRMTGLNNGMFGLAADQRPIVLTGIAIWALRDGLLAHNWVERSAFETWQALQRD